MLMHRLLKLGLMIHQYPLNRSFPIARPRRRRPCRTRDLPAACIELLEDRTLLSVVSIFDSGTGTLLVTSDADDPIVIDADENDSVRINGAPADGPIDAANVLSLSVQGGPGSNSIDLSHVKADVFTSLQTISIHGGEGKDTITGSEFDEVITGGDGDDTLIGGGGADFLEGGHGDDRLESGDPVQSSLLQAGFNDAAGINSDGDPDSPYTIGSFLAGQGVGEPGWATPWIRDHGDASLMAVQDEVVFEGDGALFASGGVTQHSRTWLDAQTDAFRVSQRIQLTEGGNIIFRVLDKDKTGIGGIGVQWRGIAGRTFEVVDAGSVVVDTGIPVPTNEWFEATMEVDVGARTWTFAVNGVEFSRPIGFRANPDDFDTVTYLVESAAGTYLDALTISGPDVSVPVPGDTLVGGMGEDTLIGNEGDDILLGGIGEDILDGRGGDDILVGGVGADTLTGGNDSDLLIGGVGGDFLNGDDGEDILIAGSTIHDDDLVALTAIRKEWTAGRPLEERIDNLTGVGAESRLNDDYFLNSTTVLDDEDPDFLNGGSSPDWFFINLSNDLWESETEDVLSAL